MSQKIIINTCYGGFNVSQKAMDMYKARTGNMEATNTDFSYTDEMRIDPTMIAIIEEIGSKAASGHYSELKIVEIPDGVEWSIQDYDGIEWVSENHRTWR